MPHIKEYFYVDNWRLNSYVEQYRGHLSTEHKTQKLELAANIDGLDVKLGQESKLRPLSIYEKIEILEKAVSKNKQLELERPKDKWQELEFIKETFKGFRVQVPPNPKHSGSKAISFWVSVPNPTDGTLCLLEDQVDDLR
jgi:hypothetical protein